MMWGGAGGEGTGDGRNEWHAGAICCSMQKAGSFSTNQLEEADATNYNRKPEKQRIGNNHESEAFAQRKESVPVFVSGEPQRKAVV